MATETTERDIDMQAVVELVVEAGYAAYVEMTGGGTATILASRTWIDKPITRNGVPAGTVRLPKERDEDGHFDVSAGPGVFDGPNYTKPMGITSDFSVALDDDDNGEIYICDVADDEKVIAAQIIFRLQRLSVPDFVVDVLMKWYNAKAEPETSEDLFEAVDAWRRLGHTQVHNYTTCDNCGEPATKHGAMAECPDGSGGIFEGDVLRS